MGVGDNDREIEVLTRDECLRLAATRSVGRLAVVEDRQPMIFPVNYVVDGDAVVLRTGAGTKLWAATRAPVAFEIDDIGDDEAWSVMIAGIAEEITLLDEASVVERLDRLPLHPLAPGDKPYVLRIASLDISGRRVRPSAQRQLPPDGTRRSAPGKCGRALHDRDTETSAHDAARSDN